MADSKTPGKILEREYVIPLRRHWLNVPEYERSGKAIKAIKKFIAKHMKVPDRDVDRVKLDIYFNNEIWFRGRASPPGKVKVKAIKENDIVKVTFAEIPEYVKFLKAKNEKFLAKAEKSKEAPKAQPQEEAARDIQEKTEEQKVDEKEKGKAVEAQAIQQAEQQQKAQKHVTKVKQPKIQRMALKK